MPTRGTNLEFPTMPRCDRSTRPARSYDGLSWPVASCSRLDWSLQPTEWRRVKLQFSRGQARRLAQSIEALSAFPLTPSAKSQKRFVICLLFPHYVLILIIEVAYGKVPLRAKVGRCECKGRAPSEEASAA